MCVCWGVSVCVLLFGSGSMHRVSRVGLDKPVHTPTESACSRLAGCRTLLSREPFCPFWVPNSHCFVDSVLCARPSKPATGCRPTRIVQDHKKRRGSSPPHSPKNHLCWSSRSNRTIRCWRFLLLFKRDNQDLPRVTWGSPQLLGGKENDE